MIFRTTDVRTFRVKMHKIYSRKFGTDGLLRIFRWIQKTDVRTTEVWMYVEYLDETSQICLSLKVTYSGLEIYTRPLVFTSSLSVRTSENCYWLALSDEWVFHSENCLIMPFRERVFQTIKIQQTNVEFEVKCMNLECFPHRVSKTGNRDCK